MANYNGLICSLTLNGTTLSQVLGTTQVTYIGCTNAVPGKFFNFGQFAMTLTQGVSGAVSVKIFGGVGGATYLIAERTASTVGSWPIPLINYVGISGSVTNQGIPRPSWVGFSGSNVSGFTANVYFAAEYN